MLYLILNIIAQNKQLNEEGVNIFDCQYQTLGYCLPTVLLVVRFSFIPFVLIIIELFEYKLQDMMTNIDSIIVSIHL